MGKSSQASERLFQRGISGTGGQFPLHGPVRTLGELTDYSKEMLEAAFGEGSIGERGYVHIAPGHGSQGMPYIPPEAKRDMEERLAAVIAGLGNSATG